MPDEVENDKTAEQPKAQEDKQEDKVEQPVKTSDSEKSFAEKTIGWIKNQFTGGEPESAESSLPEDIPDEFTDAAVAAGWPNDEIVEFANSRTDEELKELAPYLAAAVSQPSEPEPKVSEPEKTPEIKPESEKTQVDIDKLIEEKLQAKLKPLEEARTIEEVKREIERNDAYADKFMDEASKKFPQFGLRKDMPVFPTGIMKGKLVPTSPEFKARAELFSYATPWLKMGRPIEEAMEHALNTYKGKYLEKDVERALIKDLKKHEQYLSGSRTSKEVKKTYESAREEGIDVVQDLLKQEGFER